MHLSAFYFALYKCARHYYYYLWEADSDWQLLAVFVLSI